MKVLLYADFRSPHAVGWKTGLEEAGIDVIALSSEAVRDGSVVSADSVTSSIRQRYVEAAKRGRVFSSALRRLASVQLVHSLVQLVRSSSRRRQLEHMIRVHQPDLIHALRLPYEGVTLLRLKASVPRVVSSWGQDFVPQASSDPILRRWLRKYLRIADGFQYDSPDDLARARQYGLRDGVPSMHSAGNFGIDATLFHRQRAKEPGLVVYARKVTTNCNYFGYLEAVIQLVRESSHGTFVGVGLAKLEPELIRRYGAFDKRRIVLTEELDRGSFAKLIRDAEVVVSPSYSDGMPNSVLEALASGCRVVAGELPQLLPLVNWGAAIDLVDARSSAAIAAGITRQLRLPAPPDLTLPEEYSRARNAVEIEKFYSAVLSGSGK